jgi:hypothetical protein
MGDVALTISNETWKRLCQNSLQESHVCSCITVSDGRLSAGHVSSTSSYGCDRRHPIPSVEQKDRKKHPPEG